MVFIFDVELTGSVEELTNPFRSSSAIPGSWPVTVKAGYCSLNNESLV